jgi:hypothetical protein
LFYIIRGIWDQVRIPAFHDIIHGIGHGSGYQEKKGNDGED